MSLWKIKDLKVPKVIARALTSGAYPGLGKQLVEISRPNGTTAVYDLTWGEARLCPFVKRFLEVNEQSFEHFMSVYTALHPSESMVWSLELPQKHGSRILSKLDEADIDTIEDLLALTTRDKVSGIGEHYTQLLREALLLGGFLEEGEWPRP